jgi:hypothetical protein
MMTLTPHKHCPVSVAAGNRGRPPPAKQGPERALRFAHIVGAGRAAFSDADDDDGGSALRFRRVG